MADKLKKKSLDKILMIQGVCNQTSNWNGYYWENTIGNYVKDINKQLKKQGYKLQKLK